MDPRVTSSDIRTQGFSLLELLVVITVLAILTISVGFSTSLGDARTASGDDANRFVSVFKELQSGAILSQSRKGLDVSQKGWLVYHFDPSQGNWDNDDRPVKWKGDASLLLKSRKNSPYDPDIVIMPDGRHSAFAITFVSGGVSQMCSSDGWAGVICTGE
jgi:prepilin-type N-terminal cleavage/methylation domain-containing protein